MLIVNLLGSKSAPVAAFGRRFDTHLEYLIKDVVIVYRGYIDKQ